MSPVLAVLLGLVQGLTEFLPVSSSGHLVLAQQFLGLQEPMIFFDIVLHVGTLSAVCLFYWRDLLGLVGVKVPGALGTPQTAGLILLGTLPTGVIGLVGRGYVAHMFQSATLAAGALLVTGGVLWTTRFTRKRRDPRLRLRDALAIGAVQGLAITPGISRSGTTIAAGLWLGLDRDLATRYSFLLAIPAILGAVVLEWDSPRVADGTTLVALLLGLLTAAGSGYFALSWLVRVLQRGHLWKFAPYCWAVGGLALLLAGQVRRDVDVIEVRGAEVVPPTALVMVHAVAGAEAHD